jgi:hypothetical protein
MVALSLDQKVVSSSPAWTIPVLNLRQVVIAPSLRV